LLDQRLKGVRVRKRVNPRLERLNDFGVTHTVKGAASGPRT
jgi:hypothetical protein